MEKIRFGGLMPKISLKLVVEGFTMHASLVLELSVSNIWLASIIHTIICWVIRNRGSYSFRRCYCRNSWNVSYHHEILTNFFLVGDL